ncbi:hypothetical protein LCGC14_2259580 [marine sediment metagenome]|uniref:DUF2203 domain-containing protein n=1 Tax=marine sediment metagenome TaxID=412755 RepID=A0A0F9FCJ4_9ZZZZ
MRPRNFTLDEANSLLPRLGELLPQLQESKLRHDQLRERVAEYTHRMSSNGNILEQDLNETRQELAKAAAEMNSLTEKVLEMGCELKDVDQGLIDFRAEREGREVYLCWKLGEPDIRWWHGLESGFAGRRPLE